MGSWSSKTQLLKKDILHFVNFDFIVVFQALFIYLCFKIDLCNFNWNLKIKFCILNCQNHHLRYHFPFRDSLFLESWNWILVQLFDSFSHLISSLNRHPGSWWQILGCPWAASPYIWWQVLHLSPCRQSGISGQVAGVFSLWNLLCCFLYCYAVLVFSVFLMCSN